MRTRPRILLLSGGSLVGQNVLASLAERRDVMFLLAANSTAEEPMLFDFDAVYLATGTRFAPDAFARRFAELIADCQPDLVIPCRDDDVEFLAAQGEADPAQQNRFLCGSLPLARAMLDKLEGWRLSQQLGLPFVPTLDAASEPDALTRFSAEHGFPLLVKPRTGFASTGVRLVLDEKQLRHACTLPGQVVQKYVGDGAAIRTFAHESADFGLPLHHSLEGANLSLQSSIGPDGTVVGTFASDNLMRQGRSQRVRIVTDLRIADMTQQWTSRFAAAGWREPLNIQCQRAGDGTVMIHEFNGRFTGATAARRLLGFDEVGLCLRHWLNLHLADERPSSAREVVRYPALRSTDPALIAKLQRDGYWQALV